MSPPSVASRDVKAGVNALGESVTFIKEVSLKKLNVRGWLKQGMKRRPAGWFNTGHAILVGNLQFTTYSLYDCGQLNSVRVIRLYEACVNSGALVSGSPHMTGYVKGLCSLPREKEQYYFENEAYLHGTCSEEN